MQHLTCNEGLQHAGSMLNWSPRGSSCGHGSYSCVVLRGAGVVTAEGKLHPCRLSGTRIESHGPGISGSPNAEAWVTMSKFTCLCHLLNPASHIIFDDTRLSGGGGGGHKKGSCGGGGIKYTLLTPYSGPWADKTHSRKLGQVTSLSLDLFFSSFLHYICIV